MRKFSFNVPDYNDSRYRESSCFFVFSKASFSLWLYRLIRIALSAIFLWSGIAKLSDPSSFAIIIEAYGLVPDSLSLPIAILLSAAEIIAGVGLLFDIQGSLAAISIMLVCFMAILLYGMWLGLDSDCGCFGPNDPESKSFHGLLSSLFRDSILLAGIVYLYVYRCIHSVKPINLLSPFKKKGDFANE